MNLRYASINAKLKGMYAKFLNKDELYQLSRQNDLKNAVYFIKNELEVLKNIDENVTRLTMEKELDKMIIEDIYKIEKILPEKEKEIFKTYISKYEIKCIIEIYKSVHNNIDINNSSELVNVWTKEIFKNIKQISFATNDEQFCEALKNSRYYKVIKEYIENKSESLADLEMALYKKYFKDLYSKLIKLNKKALNLIGQDIDLLNIQWIYRMKKYYRLSKEEVRKKILNINYYLTKQSIEDLLELKNYEDLKRIIDSTKYSKIVQNIEEKSLEYEINKYLYNKCKKEFMIGRYNINTVFCYMTLKEFQKQNIINILGGINYKIDKREIESKIIT